MLRLAAGFAGLILAASLVLADTTEEKEEVVSIRWSPGGFVPGGYLFSIQRDGGWHFQRDGKTKKGKLDDKTRDVWLKQLGAALPKVPASDRHNGDVSATDFPCLNVSIVNGGKTSKLCAVINSKFAKALDKQVIDLVKP